jgi:hypothetical protein
MVSSHCHENIFYHGGTPCSSQNAGAGGVMEKFVDGKKIVKPRSFAIKPFFLS